MPITYTVKEGETFGQIALQHGFTDWSALYDHPDNAHFKEQRPDPRLVYPGDEIVIPEKVTKTEPVQENVLNVFVVSGAKPYLNLKLIEDVDGTVLADKPYVLTYGEKEVKGTLDDQGKLSEKLPPNVKDAMLTVILEAEPKEVALKWKIMTDAHPINTPAAIAQRLQNWGYLDAFLDDSFVGLLKSDAKAVLEKTTNAWAAFLAAREEQFDALKESQWIPWELSDKDAKPEECVGPEGYKATIQKRANTTLLTVKAYVQDIIKKLDE